MDNEALDYYIKQDGKVILSGDETSIKMIFNNLTGKNFKDNMDEYCKYKQFAKSQGFDLSRMFKMYHNETLIEVGNFIKTRT